MGQFDTYIKIISQIFSWMDLKERCPLVDIRYSLVVGS